MRPDAYSRHDAPSAPALGPESAFGGPKVRKPLPCLPPRVRRSDWRYLLVTASRRPPVDASEHFPVVRHVGPSGACVAVDGSAKLPLILFVGASCGVLARLTGSGASSPTERDTGQAPDRRQSRKDPPSKPDRPDIDRTDTFFLLIIRAVFRSKNSEKTLILSVFCAVVAEDGIEPPTQGFSVLSLTVPNCSLKFRSVQ